MGKISLINKHIDGADTCVLCGRDIPEGSQYCVICGQILVDDKSDSDSELEDIPLPTDVDAPREFIKEPCYLCDNARLNHELEDYNDFSSSCIGNFSQDCRIMLTSGSGKPLRIEIARWCEEAEQWVDIGVYYPKFCPECGREIREYENDSVVK